MFFIDPERRGISDPCSQSEMRPREVGYPPLIEIVASLVRAEVSGVIYEEREGRACEEAAAAGGSTALHAYRSSEGAILI